MICDQKTRKCTFSMKGRFFLDRLSDERAIQQLTFISVRSRD